MNPVMTGGKTGRRSVILVTNALQYLKHPKVSKIVVVQEGRIVEQGTYLELSRRRDSIFSRFLAVIEETGISGMEGVDLTTVSKDEAKRRKSSKQVQEEIPKTGVKTLMTQETRLTGHVTFDVYKSWAMAAGGWIVPVIIVGTFAIGEFVQVGSNWFLTFWSAHGSVETQGRFLAIYALINIVSAVVSLVRLLVVAIFGLVASRRVSSLLLSVPSSSHVSSHPPASPSAIH